MIATALAGDPLMLIADEPTTALDVTVQASVLDLLYELGESRGLAVLLITHDLSIVAGFTEQVMVMYGGRIVESAATDQIYQHPKHPYTAALLQSIPSQAATRRRLADPGVPTRTPEPATWVSVRTPLPPFRAGALRHVATAAGSGQQPERRHDRRVRLCQGGRPGAIPSRA